MRVLNPIAETQSVMRSTLVGSLVEVLRVNLARKASRVRVFELGKVYLRDPTLLAGPLNVAGVRQPLKLGGLAFGPAAPPQWGVAERPVDFFDVKGDLEALMQPARARFVPAPHPALHPGRSAAIELGGARVGFIGELHPRWRQAYELPAPAIVFEIDAEALMAPIAADVRAAAEAAIGLARHRHRRAPRRHASGADGGDRRRRRRPRPRARRCSTSTSRKSQPPASMKASAVWRSASSCVTTAAR